MSSLFGGGRAAKILVLVFLASTSRYLIGQDSCRQRTVLVNVADAHGMPIPGLTASDFKVSYRAGAATIVNASYKETPRRVVVLLDMSDSMTGRPSRHSPHKWAMARRAAMEFLNAADEKTEVSFSTFAEKIETRIPSSAGRKAIADWLNKNSVVDSLSLKGKTALFDSIFDVLQELQPFRVGDSVFVITDGGNDLGASSKRKVSLALQSSGTRLFALLLKDPIPIPATGVEEFDGLLKTSGGLAFDFSPVPTSPDPSRADFVYDEPPYSRLKSTVAAVAAQVADVYSVTLQLSENPSKLESWKLELVHSENQSKKEVTLAYPPEILPCSH